ncbi:sugar transporter [Levilactobacillus suantsaii]|uniref:GRP family sugar transporter n=1 Tax=Levilactobacillus suantsaii TaxID=2292255 RepID=UPI0015F673A8|nr:GRP family sugar transporter [Levilactobacillus suantsaii]QMU08498.1 sugar transporter [Levilactobacillus suantsaii]
MNILIGLIPALFWGILPIWMRKLTGGSCLQQLLGTSMGIVMTATALQVIFRFNISAHDFGLYFISGAFWSICQCGQYWGYGQLGVSLTMPLSTAFQIIGNSLIGGWLFGEWRGIQDTALGLGALMIIVVGVANGVGGLTVKNLRGYLLLLATTFGYWGYSGFPHYANSTSGINGFLPQALGMLSTSLILYLVGRHRLPGNDPAGLRNITSGLIFSVSSSVYLISLQLNDLVNAFVLTQLNVVVATLLGIVILKEADPKRTLTTSAGLGILIAGAVVMVQI